MFRTSAEDRLRNIDVTAESSEQLNRIVDSLQLIEIAEGN